MVFTEEDKTNRLKASVLVNCEHLEHWMICWLSYQQHWLGILKNSLNFNFVKRN